MLRTWLIGVIAAASLAVTTTAAAQYGGPGGMGGTGSPTYTKKSYGVNKAAMAAVIGAAGVGGGLLLWKRHHRTLTACVGSDGATLDDGKDVYTVVGSPLTPGERIIAAGKKVKSDDGTPAFEVRSVRKDLGRCEQQPSVSAQKQ